MPFQALGLHRPGARAAVLFALAAVIGIAVAVPAAGSARRQSADGQPTLVSEQLLPTGAVKRTYSNGSIVVGNPNATVGFVLDSAGKTIGVNVADPGPRTADEGAEMAASYQASGRSVQSDAAAAGIDPSTVVMDTGPTSSGRPLAFRGSLARPLHSQHNYMTPNVVYDSGCTTIDSYDMYWHGCYTRKGTSSSDVGRFYLADQSQAAGHAKVGGYWLIRGSTHHQYANSNLIVQWRPGSDLQGNNCSQATIGANFYGASLSVSYTLCPTIDHINIGTQNFDSQWQGCKGSQNTPGVGATTWTRAPDGADTTLYYGIYSATKNTSC